MISFKGPQKNVTNMLKLRVIVASSATSSCPNAQVVYDAQHDLAMAARFPPEDMQAVLGIQLNGDFGLRCPLARPLSLSDF